jgi:hypothetical protein
LATAAVAVAAAVAHDDATAQLLLLLLLSYCGTAAAAWITPIRLSKYTAGNVELGYRDSNISCLVLQNHHVC